ncbi:MAG TPA: tetratricopeptide repeat protein [Candidatus Acidoferrum sp.]|jgi:tetratricopeptide (TPR) repeat protein|nr:tetratricopeptide repeat protein [Candidatus Acidoferrum sp.]
MAMLRYRLLLWLMFLAVCPAFGQDDAQALAKKSWYEASTAHFNIYSCGDVQDTYRLAARLEQFCRAYAMLAGKDAVESPPIVALAFPDHDSMKPFLPLYNGQPGNIAGFFTRGSDENLIVLSLPNSDSPDMDIIFHEYAHLLFRRNDQIWPLWLKEGMAEIYSTFTTSGRYCEIARPIDRHLQTLANEPLMSLDELFAVTHDSPQYNEATRQGVFYAESWALTHYLLAGDNAILQSRFSQFTPLLKQGEMPEEAFTNALGVSLPAMQNALQNYVKRNEFDPIVLKLSGTLSAPVNVSSRAVTPVEILFRFGDEQLRIGRLDSAQDWFTEAQQLAPLSPLPWEGLGLLASQRNDSGGALSDLQQALHLGSNSFLAHYIYAQEKYHQTATGNDMYAPIHSDLAGEIQGELEKSVQLMPTFAPAHELLGFFEMVQGSDLTAAEQQLNEAIQLEPENPSYLFTLAQAQLHDRDLEDARRTLAPLLLPNVDAKLRASARELAQQINSGN